MIPCVWLEQRTWSTMRKKDNLKKDKRQATQTITLARAYIHFDDANGETEDGCDQSFRLIRIEIKEMHELGKQKATLFLWSSKHDIETC